MKKDSPVIFFLILLGLLALGIGAVIFLQQYVPDTIKAGSSMSEKSKAEGRCLEVVKAALRYPAKAKFSSQAVDLLGKNQYQATGNVDAPNASGIIVRGHYICVFNTSTKSFDLLSLEGDDVWKPLQK